MPAAYLTIDDAPSPDLPQKLDLLDNHNIPAVLFCEGRFLDDRPSIAIDAINRGYHLGNHSYSHPYFSDLTLPQARHEIRRTHQLINTLYDQADTTRPVNAFRFPYGDPGRPEHHRAIQETLTRLNYKPPQHDDITYHWWTDNRATDAADWYWTVNLKEYEAASVSDITTRITDQQTNPLRRLTTQDSADILLTHDHPETTPYFPPIITSLQDLNVQFKDPLTPYGD